MPAGEWLFPKTFQLTWARCMLGLDVMKAGRGEGGGDAPSTASCANTDDSQQTLPTGHLLFDEFGETLPVEGRDVLLVGDFQESVSNSLVVELCEKSNKT